MATAPTCGTCGNVFYDKAALRARAVDPILLADSLNPADLDDANFIVSTNVPLNPLTNPVGHENPMGDMGTVVSISYPMRFPLYGVKCCPMQLTHLSAGITITTQVQMREEH